MKLKSISGGTHYRISDVDAGKLARGVNAKLPAWGREVRVQLPNGKLAWLRREHYTSRLYTDAPKRGWTWIVWDREALTPNARGGPVDHAAAGELKLYIDNDGDLYKQGAMYRAALAKRMTKGTFDAALAAKGFGWIVDAGAKKYANTPSTGYAWNVLFSPATRKQVAKEMAEEWAGEYRIQHRLTRNAGEMERAMERGCPTCHSDATHETTCSVDGRDNVPCVVCDDCGHTVFEKPRQVRRKPGMTSNRKRTSRRAKRTSRRAR
jgi:hypothetical protein